MLAYALGLNSCIYLLLPTYTLTWIKHNTRICLESKTNQSTTGSSSLIKKIGNNLLLLKCFIANVVANSYKKINLVYKKFFSTLSYPCHR